MTSSVVKTEKKLQSTPQSQSCTKKWSWSLFGGLLAGLIYYSFLNPRETITSEKYAQKVDEIHQKLQCHCWHWSAERAQFFSMTIPGLM